MKVTIDVPDDGSMRAVNAPAAAHADVVGAISARVLECGARGTEDDLERLHQEITELHGKAGYDTLVTAWKAAAARVRQRRGDRVAAESSLLEAIRQAQTPEELAEVARTAERTMKGRSDVRALLAKREAEILGGAAGASA